MFTRVFAVASLAALAVANPLAVRGAQCSNGAVQCCQQTQKVMYFFRGLFALPLTLSSVIYLLQLVRQERRRCCYR